MLSSLSLPESQAALALSIFLATFLYEDGATLLAATLSAGGRVDPWIALLSTFLGIWMGDLGLYGLGCSFGRRAARLRWLRKYLSPELLAKAQGWFARQGLLALITSRAIPGSRLPLYLAAGALGFPVRLFAKTTAVCSAAWASAIFAIWRFSPKTFSGHQKFLPWLLTASMLFAPWLVRGPLSGLLRKTARSLGGRIWKRKSVRDHRAVGLCAL